MALYHTKLCNHSCVSYNRNPFLRLGLAIGDRLECDKCKSFVVFYLPLENVRFWGKLLKADSFQFTSVDHNSYSVVGMAAGYVSSQTT